ncbi:MAG: capsule assembly Wzi family protein [Muribaculaceae bacterium]|nr:capsule assembly Wzi family protein [Muribaculaceae bacterium]
MSRRLLSLSTAIASLLATTGSAWASYPLKIDAEVIAGESTGTFAPYYVASNNHGRITQPGTFLVDAGVHASDTIRNTRLKYSWGAEGILSVTNKIDYTRYIEADNEWIKNPQRPPVAWLQQLYGRLDYRSLFLQAGLVNSHSALLNDNLSSGDLIESPNARAIPQVRAGFNDFQPIPFTRGWVEIQGEISYGKMSDNGWIKNHANFYNDHTCLGTLYTYKRCYFRTKSSQPFSVTVGMQVAGFFGGTTTVYRDGVVTKVEKNPAGIKEFFKMLIPSEGDESYYLGSMLGCWDIHLRYNLPWGDTVKGYLQKPWETGSGIGFLNGFDGLWGIEYKRKQSGFVDGVVVEYLDFTNQSGPLHFDPADLPDCTITDHTDGGDDYYNNYQYNSYANYGMSLGTPFLPAPIYNLDGYLQFADNAVRGFHIGLTGTVSPHVGYRLLGGYRKSWGTVRIPRAVSRHDTSWMAEVTYRPFPVNDYMRFKGTVAMDRGTLYGNTFGCYVSMVCNLDLNKLRR